MEGVSDLSSLSGDSSGDDFHKSKKRKKKKANYNKMKTAAQKISVELNSTKIAELKKKSTHDVTHLVVKNEG